MPLFSSFHFVLRFHSKVFGMSFQQLACNFWAIWHQYLEQALAKHSSKVHAKRNFLEDGNIDAFLFEHNLEFKISQEVVMTWNACTCHDLIYINMPWLGVRGSTMILDAWARHGLECMSMSRLRWEGIESDFPSLSDALWRFSFCPLV